MKGMRKFKAAEGSHLLLAIVGCQIDIGIIPKASFSVYLLFLVKGSSIKASICIPVQPQAPCCVASQQLDLVE